MNEEGFEEWDADFLDQLIQVEELALTSAATQNPNPIPSQRFIHLEQQEPPRPVAASCSSSHYDTTIRYSPPRELSQRNSDYDAFSRFSDAAAKCASVSRSGNDQELEIGRLKRELGHVQKQLTELEHECLELRKAKDKKEEQLRNVFSKNKVKDGDVHSTKSANLGRGVIALDHQGVLPTNKDVLSSGDQNGFSVDRAIPTHKVIGVQTEIAGDPAQVILDDDPLASHVLSEKLFAIWGSPGDQRHGRNLIPELLVTCQRDFHVLFGFISMNMSDSDIASEFHLHTFQTSEAAKVSQLYTILTKITNGEIPLDALLEPLLDLCRLENVIIVHRSLCILHGFLKQLLSLEMNSGRRDNVTVGALYSGNYLAKSHGSDSGLCGVSINETIYAGCYPIGSRLPVTEISCKETWNHDLAISVFHVDWVSLVEVMHQIVMRNTEECVKAEAVSVMNVILVKAIAYLERERFGQTVMFESLPQLLRKEAGLRVQKNAVHLLYLLLNCPKLLVMFCSGCNEVEGAAAVDNDARPQEFIEVLHGLADCMSCCGNGIEELTLRKNAIIVLAFLASSGKPGFEILASPKLHKEKNFLLLILRVLTSELDSEAAVGAEPPEISEERTLLIRETLILLNRLVSNPAYSVTALRMLTSGREMASLTIDIANRLSRKVQRHGQSDAMARQMRETEIVNLARVFKKRVFTYLGNNIP